jgi:hypothetical protein
MSKSRKKLSTRGKSGNGMSFTYKCRKFLLSKDVLEKETSRKSVQEEVRRHFIMSSQLILPFYLDLSKSIPWIHLCFHSLWWLLLSSLPVIRIFH